MITQTEAVVEIKQEEEGFIDGQPDLSKVFERHEEARRAFEEGKEHNGKSQPA